MLQIFKAKCIVNFRKYRSIKKFRFGGVKIAKSNKIEKTEELIAGYQEAVVLRQTLQQMVLANLSKKSDMSGKLFW